MLRLTEHIQSTEKKGTVLRFKTLEFSSLSDVSKILKNQSDCFNAIIYCDRPFETSMKILMNHLNKSSKAYAEFDVPVTATSYLCDFSFFVDGVEYNAVYKRDINKTIVIPMDVDEDIFKESIIIELG